METKRISTPEVAVNTIAQAAHTARQIFCIDESPLPILLTKMTWSAEEIALKNNCPTSVMDGFYRTVFSEHQTNVSALTKQELLDTQTALLDFLSDDKSERVLEGITEWDELLEAAAQEVVV